MKTNDWSLSLGLRLILLSVPLSQAQEVRKVRWSRPGSGKRGGVRVIYYNRTQRGEVWLLLIYAKSARENIPNQVIKSIREEIEK